MMHPKKLENLLRLSAQERYDYFVRTSVGYKQVWVLEIEGNQPVMFHDGEDTVLPVWLLEELAEHCMFPEHRDLGAYPRSISLDSFMDKCIPDMVDLEIYLGVFYNDTLEALLVPGNALREDLKEQIKEVFGEP